MKWTVSTLKNKRVIEGFAEETFKVPQLTLV